MGNKLRLVQHDELKGGIISMFIHLFEEMCVCMALLPIDTPPFSHLLDFSHVCLRASCSCPRVHQQTSR